MNIERVIREQIYLSKRRRKHKKFEKSRLLTRENKKILGLILILCGVLLIVSRCSKPNVNPKTTQISYATTLLGDISLSQKLCYD